MSLPLAGVRVLDLTMMISGPSASMVLADQGADVIKIEAPNRPDHTRGVSTDRGGMSASFLNNNRNKRSIVIDLKAEAGKAVFLHLVETADVVMQNFRPGVMDRLGLGEAALREIKPDLIYTSISGFGETGPYAAKPVYDPLIQALSGLATVQAGSDEHRPRLVRTILPDKLTGWVAAQAITAALVRKATQGEGAHIRLSMLDAVISFLWGSDMGAHTFVGDELKTERAQSFIDLIYETAEGYISVAVQSDREWRGLCAALDTPDWLDDPRFANPSLRGKNIDARLELTQAELLKDTAANWLKRLEAEDVPCAPVLTRREAIRHEQVAANALILEYDHPDAGLLRQTRPPARISGMDRNVRQPAPQMGQHTETVLLEAGYKSSEISDLMAENIIAGVKIRTQ